MILSKECNKRVNKFLKKCSYVNFQGDDIEKMTIEYRKALNSKYQLQSYNFNKVVNYLLCEIEQINRTI